MKKLRVEDTEAYKEMMWMDYEIFYEFFYGYFSHFTICHFGLSLFLAKLLIIRPFKQQKYFIDYQVEFENVQTTWLLVIVDDSSCLNTPDSWNYHKKLWPFERGLTLKL